MWYKRYLTALLCFFTCLAGRAQLCQGILGDPVVHIDFGSGSNPGAALNAASTNYIYTTTPCPTDGYYTVCNSSTACYGVWHTLPTDHTGNPNGYMMLVNAATAPGVFYQDTIDLPCSNTTYEFAAWIVTMNKPNECNGNPNKPNLTFSILNTNGTLIQSYSSGNMPLTQSPQWNQYGFFFNLPGSVNRVILRIVNNASGGCGNDLALDDITFRPCGPVVTPTMNGQAITSLDYCKGQTATVNMAVQVDPNYVNAAYQWQSSTNSGQSWNDLPGAVFSQLPFTIAPNTNAQKYLFRCAVMKPENIGASACRSYTQPFTIWVHDPPQASASTNAPVCEGKPLQLSAQGGVSYAWAGPDGYQSTAQEFIRSPSTAAMAGDYRVTVTDSYGCVDMDMVTVQLNAKPALSVTPAQQTICRGDTAAILAAGGLNYQWSGGSFISNSGGAVTLAPTDSVRIQVIGAAVNGCTDTVQALVHVNHKPQADAGPDEVMVMGQQLFLSGAATGDGIQYYWTPGNYLSNPQDLHTQANPPGNTTYVLHVESNGLCGSATDTMHITVLKDIFIPDAFTPNGDGKNDTWAVLGLALFKDFKVQVFNRYGETVFLSSKAGESWDGRYGGRPQNNGVYVYLVEIPSLGVHLKGTIMLIR